MKNFSITLFLLFCLIIPLSSLYAKTVDSMLIKLDEYLLHQNDYEQQKKKQINKWDSIYISSISDEKRYEASINLFNEYKSYKYDSAYYYSHHALQLAQKLQNKGYIVESNNAIVFCLMSSGLFKEAFDRINTIDINNTPLAQRISYYSLCSRLYYDIADYNHEAPFQQEYLEKGSLYTDSLISLIPENSLKWLYAIGQRQMKDYQYDACVLSFKTLLNKEGLDSRTEAIISSSLGWVYWLQGNKDFATNYLIRAAISDIRSATKETTALRVLASLLYERGDINRANNYVQIALDDANFYNARHRKIEIGSILPIIEKERFEIVNKQRKTLILGVVIFSFLIFLLLTTTIITYRQMKKIRLARQTIMNHNLELQSINQQLSEVNKIKDEYIGYSFYLNSEYINKMESLYKMINRKIKTQQYEDLRNSFKDSTLNKERDNMYASFDETFLKLFPGFITSYNKLFPQDEVAHSDSNSLTPEMRIFALIRLGISESERIAKFLNYSVHTINTYKTRVKNRSVISNDLFESKIMEIVAVKH